MTTLVTCAQRNAATHVPRSRVEREQVQARPRGAPLLETAKHLIARPSPANMEDAHATVVMQSTQSNYDTCNISHARGKYPKPLLNDHGKGNPGVKTQESNCACAVIKMAHGSQLQVNGGRQPADALWQTPAGQRRQPGWRQSRARASSWPSVLLRLRGRQSPSCMCTCSKGVDALMMTMMTTMMIMMV